MITATDVITKRELHGIAVRTRCAKLFARSEFDRLLSLITTEVFVSGVVLIHQKNFAMGAFDVGDRMVFAQKILREYHNAQPAEFSDDARRVLGAKFPAPDPTRAPDAGGVGVSKKANRSRTASSSSKALRIRQLKISVLYGLGCQGILGVSGHARKRRLHGISRALYRDRSGIAGREHRHGRRCRVALAQRRCRSGMRMASSAVPLRSGPACRPRRWRQG